MQSWMNTYTNAAAVKQDGEGGSPSTPYQYLHSFSKTHVHKITVKFKLFTCFFEITYLFWKCLLKPSSGFPFLWLVDVLLCRTLIGCRENVQNLYCHSRLWVWFTGSLAASRMHFQGQNRRFRVSEEGYWIWELVSIRVQDKTLTLIFFKGKNKL